LRVCTRRVRLPFCADMWSPFYAHFPERGVHQTGSIPDRLPAGFQVEFVRWKQKQGGEKLHNRYVLTDLGGVSLGVGLDEGEPGESDDLLLLPRPQYEHRWSQYVGNDGAFELENLPVAVRGTRTPRSAPVQRGRI